MPNIEPNTEPKIELTQMQWERVLSLFQRQKKDKAKINKAKDMTKDIEKMGKAELIELVRELTD